MSFKDYFLPLYVFSCIRWAQTQNISSWVMDLRLIFRHLCGHFKDDTCAVEFCTCGNNFSFQKAMALVLGLLYNYAISSATASFFFLICVAHSVPGSYYSRSVFLGLKGQVTCAIWWAQKQCLGPLCTRDSLTLNFIVWLHFMRNILFPLQKSFHPLNRRQ